jgi:formate dehydrogenase subunit gamma
MEIFRFSKGVRAFHWSVAVPVVSLLTTGLAMTGRSFGLFPMVTKQTLLAIHTGIGFLLPGLVMLVLLGAGTKMVKQEILPAFKLDEDDLRWGVATFRNLFNKKVQVPPSAKFNGGQKMNAIMSLVWITILCLSGFVMAMSKGNVLAHIVHVIAFSMFVPGLLVHLFMATLNPSTRCSLGGMVHGYVPDQYLQHHHALYFKTFAPQIIGDLFVSQLTRKKDLLFVYRKLYQSEMTIEPFWQLVAGSEAMIGVWQEKELVFFCRVVGDGQRIGFLVDLHGFTLEPDSELMAKIKKGAGAVVGHPLILSSLPQK